MADVGVAAPHSPALDFCFAISCIDMPAPPADLPLFLRLVPPSRLANASPLALGFCAPAAAAPKPLLIEAAGEVTADREMLDAGLAACGWAETEVK